MGHGARGVARLLEVDGELRRDLPGAGAVPVLQTFADFAMQLDAARGVNARFEHFTIQRVQEFERRRHGAVRPLGGRTFAEKPSFARELSERRLDLGRRHVAAGRDRRRGARAAEDAHRFEHGPFRGIQTLHLARNRAADVLGYAK